MPALVLGANLPDVDVVSYAWGGLAALDFRRGWTHGVLALAVLPLVLTGLLLVWDRLVRRRRRPDAPPVDRRRLLVLSYAAVLTHPFLDFLNTYGMRWLMPFKNEWYYGDTLFIVDPWIWATLGLGILLARRWEARGRGWGATRPARVALGMVSGYILLMGLTSGASRVLVGRMLDDGPGHTLERLMVAPLPVTPLSRDVLIASNGTYRRALLGLFPRPRLVRDADQARWWLGSPPTQVDAGASHPAAIAAAATTEGRTFLRWARFPYFRVHETRDGFVVRIIDARYEADWASLILEVPKAGVFAEAVE